jgi:hypothetical protein
MKTKERLNVKGKFSLSLQRDRVRITIEDDNANITFLKIEMLPKDFYNALTSLACNDCNLELNGLDKLGKKHESKSFEFEIPEKIYDLYSDKSKKSKIIAQKILDKQKEGWIAEEYFNSQNTFSKENNKCYAQCTIRRWI